MNSCALEMQLATPPSMLPDAKPAPVGQRPHVRLPLLWACRADGSFSGNGQRLLREVWTAETAGMA